MSNYFLVVVEVDEYSASMISDFMDDIDIRESISESFYGYIDCASDYSKVIFSKGPFNENCCLLFYKEVPEEIIEISESDKDSALNIIDDLNRKLYLFLVNSDDYNLLIAQSLESQDFGKISNFKISDIVSTCIDMELFYD